MAISARIGDNLGSKRKYLSLAIQQKYFTVCLQEELEIMNIPTCVSVETRISAILQIASHDYACSF